MIFQKIKQLFCRHRKGVILLYKDGDDYYCECGKCYKQFKLKMER